jgi:hypothetical protein
VTVTISAEEEEEEETSDVFETVLLFGRTRG